MRDKVRVVGVAQGPEAGVELGDGAAGQGAETAVTRPERERGVRFGEEFGD